MKQGKIVVLALGAAVLFVASRKPKTRRPAAKTTTPELEDEGIGYSELLERNVKWGVYRDGADFFYTYETFDEKNPLSSGKVGGHSSSEDAFTALEEELGLEEHPQPPKPPEEEPPVGEEEPPPPGPGSPLPEPPGEMVQVPPGEPPPPAVALFNATVYPDGADESKLPALTDAYGLIMSEDGTVAGVGPLWWDAVGERVEELYGEGLTTREEHLSTIQDEQFPPGLEPIHYAGLLALYNELANKIDAFLAMLA